MRTSSAPATRSRPSGRMRDLQRLDGEVEELDGRGLWRDSRARRLSHARVLRRRPRRGVRVARRRRVATRSSTPRAAGSWPPSARRGRQAKRCSRRRCAEHRGWMLRAGTTTFESKSGYGLDRETELASLRAIRAAGGVPTWLGAHAVPPEFDDGDAYLDFALSEVLPAAAELAEAADVFLERGAFDVGQARRYLEACARGRPRAAHPRRPVHGAGCGSARRRARRASRSTTSRPRGQKGWRRSRAATSPRCSCRRARSFSRARCRRHARWSTRARSSRWRRTSTRAAPSARACRSCALSPPRS